MEKNNEQHIILGALLVVLVLVGGYVWFKSHGKKDNSKDNQPASGVEVTNFAPEAKSERSVPEGFPALIPIEVENITQSYKAVYKDKGVTQYTVSYTSDKSKDDIWKSYEDFFESSNTIVDESVTNKAAGRLVGTKFNDTVTIGITKQGSITYVQLSVLHRDVK